MHIFNDVLMPVINLSKYPDSKRQRAKIGRLIDSAIIFGVIQEREKTGGFEGFSTEMLVKMYAQKVGSEE